MRNTDTDDRIEQLAIGLQAETDRIRAVYSNADVSIVPLDSDRFAMRVVLDKWTFLLYNVECQDVKTLDIVQGAPMACWISDVYVNESDDEPIGSSVKMYVTALDALNECMDTIGRLFEAIINSVPRRK